MFHLFNDRPLYFDRMIALLHMLGIEIQVTDSASFSEALKNTMHDARTEHIYEAFRRDMDQLGRLNYDTNIHVDTAFTSWFLKQTGFVWPETDLRYLSGYITYFRNLGYFTV